MAKIGIENLQDNVVVLLNTSEDLSQLETNHKDSLVGAINEIIDNKDTRTREMLANSIGSPVVKTDTIPEMCTKIDSMEDKFKGVLTNLGIEVTSNDVIDSMIDKIATGVGVVDNTSPFEYTVKHNIGKTPKIIFAIIPTYRFYSGSGTNLIVSNLTTTSYNITYNGTVTITDINDTSFTITKSSGNGSPTLSGEIHWYAIL